MNNMVRIYIKLRNNIIVIFYMDDEIDGKWDYWLE